MLRMYCIVVYDVGVDRVTKVMKLMREYLHHVQNSVFEGELTPGQLEELKYRAQAIMKRDEDSMIIYRLRNQKWLQREIVGVEKRSTSQFI